MAEKPTGQKQRKRLPCYHFPFRANHMEKADSLLWLAAIENPDAYFNTSRASEPGSLGKNSVQSLGVRLPASELYKDRGAGWGLLGLVHGLRRIKSAN